MSHDVLTRALRTIADEHPPPSLPGDLWQRGRRRRRLRIAAGVLAAAAAVALVAPAVAAYRPDPTPLPPTDHPPAVPSVVYPPVGFARTVFESPPGPAAIVLNGDFDQTAVRTLVVGRDREYRVIEGPAADWSGGHVPLSSDGRWLAVGGVAGDPAPAASVVDLVTGTQRPVGFTGPALAWSPDGRLLVLDRSTDVLWLVDLESRQRQTMSTAVTENAYVAFSVDGSLLALQRGATLDLIDVVTGRGFRQLEIGGQRRLAGPGAWTAAGEVALWECDGACPDGTLDPETVRLTLLDPGTAGYTSPGFGPLTGDVPRLLGWRPDGTAVVHTSQPRASSAEPDNARIVALGPDGPTTLVDLPAGLVEVSLAADLIRGNRYDGPPPGAFSRAGETLYGIATMIWPLAVVAALVLAVWRLRRPWTRRRAS